MKKNTKRLHKTLKTLIYLNALRMFFGMKNKHIFFEFFKFLDREYSLQKKDMETGRQRDRESKNNNNKSYIHQMNMAFIGIS